ncbi:hypothetical protein OHD62_31085 [Mesorhizobium sp. YC-39]|uniref:hypothetical protein n=1 Tax=unclassified Mesorhizobium TaxID=325217 RepID=UPI0021E75FD3|nr:MULTISPECIES: hypothetical protein [unclassified Mesorhizobium]MCV3211111.1 hypothetical protein [Mesorhizobium sp. YC-2]MCV3232836.1 hypothetical protein [Mesorhizobium sp. YC-39]
MANPVTATIRAYQMGFGDCFLLSFAYEDESSRHILIDFGSTGLPDETKVGLDDVAADIALQCGGVLDIVVATHRHKDHISGFATKANGKGSGDVIRSLKPKRVIQPWTEAPDAPEGWSGPDGTSTKRAFATQRASLENMHAVAQAVVDRLDRKGGFDPRWPLAERLRFVGEENIKNVLAVKNLMDMTGTPENNLYVYHGCDLDLAEILPNVKVHVLGPPTLKQSDSIKAYAKNSADYWLKARQLVGLAATGAVAASKTSMLFPDLKSTDTFRQSKLPTEMRWVAERVDIAEQDQMLGIVTALDDVMNNTSVILLFEAGSKKLLFPGDAQLENWNYALQSELAHLLDDVDLYKVGHHGSLNATPKSMWNRFQKRGKASKPDRLKTVMSTMAGKHGGKNGAPTEVPRIPFVNELKADSTLFNTQDLQPTQLCQVISIDLR